jgi:hypothetical protein
MALRQRDGAAMKTPGAMLNRPGAIPLNDATIRAEFNRGQRGL